MAELTPNEQLQAAILSHQVGVMRLTRREERSAALIIAREYARLQRQLLNHLEGGGSARFTVDHLRSILAELERAANPDGPLAQWISQKQVELGLLEAIFQENLAKDLVGVLVQTIEANDALEALAALSREGATTDSILGVIEKVADVLGLSRTSTLADIIGRVGGSRRIRNIEDASKVAHRVAKLFGLERADLFGKLFEIIVSEPTSAQAVLGMARLGPEQVVIAAKGALFGGGPMFFRSKAAQAWLDALSPSRQRRLRLTLAQALIGQETVDDAALRIQQVLGVNRREALTIARSGLLASTNSVREKFYEWNQSVFAAVRWVSTLDGRTTPMCIARDQKLYSTPAHEPIDHEYEWGPGPGALHFNCRSTSVPVLRDRPDLGLFASRPTERAAAGGPVRGDMDYEEWLRGQSRELQEAVLGVQRAELFRSGIGLDRLLEPGTGEFLTLDELAATDAQILKILSETAAAAASGSGGGVVVTLEDGTIIRLDAPEGILGAPSVPIEDLNEYLRSAGARRWNVIGPLPDGVEKMEFGQCYANASRLFMEDPERYAYVEGVAYQPDLLTGGSFGFMHAWVVDRDTGEVIDPTWGNPDGALYYGVEYDSEQYLRLMRREEVFGVLGGRDDLARRIVEAGSLDEFLSRLQGLSKVPDLEEFEMLKQVFGDEALRLGWSGVSGLDALVGIDPSIRIKMKARIASNLADRLSDKGIHIEADEIDLMMRERGRTSTRSSDSLAFQLAVRQEFDLPSTGLGHVDPGRMFVASRWLDGTSIPAGTFGEELTRREFFRALARAQYDATQDLFHDLGITHVSLLRGIRDLPQADDGWITLALNPATSFTPDIRTAMSFAVEDPDRAVVAIRVPVEKILSLATTGMGDLREMEVLVLGGEYSAVGVWRRDMDLIREFEDRIREMIQKVASQARGGG